MKGRIIILYGRALIALSIISLAISVILSIYGNLYPIKMSEGNIVFNIGYLIFAIDIFILIFTVILGQIVYKKLPDNYDFKLKTAEIIFIIIGIIYCVYRMFFFKKNDELLRFGDTTLMIYLALGIFMDIIIVTCIPKLINIIYRLNII